jgi:hypothetical protein
LELPSGFAETVAEALEALASHDRGYLLEVSNREADSLARLINQARQVDRTAPLGVFDFERALRYQNRYDGG